MQELSQELADGSLEEALCAELFLSRSAKYRTLNLEPQASEPQDNGAEAESLLTQSPEPRRPGKGVGFRA